jgi:hypothetical protein
MNYNDNKFIMIDYYNIIKNETFIFLSKINKIIILYIIYNNENKYNKYIKNTSDTY